MYINVIFQTISFYITQASRSFTFLFMYLGELLQYYQLSNNLPQSVQTLDFDLKSCFVLLNSSSRSTCCGLVCVLIIVALVWFPQDLESLCSLQSCVRLNLSCFCVAQHLKLLSSFFTCLRLNLSSFVLLKGSSRSARCRLVSVSIFAA